ncbi:MFS transporter [Brevibacillus borstelensis]|uniref:MFS transporter n=1 Tax=Brevibacillus borstelensis TaxID=45462 RepID=UPI0030C60EC1
MNRNLKLLWFTDASSIFGTSVYTLALTLLSLQYSDSALGAGAVLFVSVIPYFFLGIIGGVIVDRVDRKAIMLFCGWTRGLLTLSIPIAHAADALTLGHIVTVSFVMTCLRAFFFPSIQASIPLLVDDKKDLNKVNAYFGSTQNLGLMLGPSLGGILLQFDLDVAELLYIDSVSYFISALLISFIRIPKPEKQTGSGKKPTILQDAWRGIAFISVGNKEIAIMIASFAAQLLIGAGVVQLGIPKVLEAADLGGQKSYGFVISIVSLSSMLSSFWLSKRKVLQPAKWIFAGYALRGVSFFLLGFPGSMLGIVLSALIQGFGNTISGTTLTTVLQLRTPNEMLGKVMALRSSVGNVADAFAYLLIGGLLSAFSLPLAFVAVTVYVFGTTAIFYGLWLRQARQQARMETPGQSVGM